MLYPLGVLLFNDIHRIFGILSTSLQTLHLAELQLAEILLAQMHAANLVTHRVGCDVLLGALLGAARLLHGLLEHRLIGLPDSADTEIHARTDLLNLNTGKTLTGSLGTDGVDSQVDGGLNITVASAILCANGDDVLETLDVNLVTGLALEEIKEHALRKGELVADRALKSSTSEQDHRPQTNGEFLSLELSNRTEALRVEVELKHVKDLITESANKSQGMGTLLLAATKNEETGVVLFGEKLERGGVVKGMDGVLLGELLSERLAHLMKVVEGILDDLRACCSAEEEARLGILVCLWFALLEGSL